MIQDMLYYIMGGSGEANKIGVSYSSVTSGLSENQFSFMKTEGHRVVFRGPTVLDPPRPPGPP
jgi:hypothetical protein